MKTILFISIVCCSTISCIKRTDNSNISTYESSTIFIQQNTATKEWKRLVENNILSDIKQAVETYETISINKQIPFDIFCDYVLPPKIFYEPISDWRNKCFKQYGYLKNKSTFEICDSINNKMKNGFKFGGYVPSYITIGWDSLENIKSGNCYHMAKSIIYPLRALGIPVTIDFVYNWGNASGAHCWNVVYVDGKMIPFMGKEANPNQYNPFLVHEYEPDTTKSVYRYPAKVYRKTYSLNPEIIQLQQEIPLSELPIILSDARIKDVTAEYFPVSDIILNNKGDYPVAYLAIYSDDWQLAAAAASKKAIFKFCNMKHNMLYMPVIYKEKNIIPIDPPFILNEEGLRHTLKADFKHTNSVTIKYLYPLLSEFLYAWASIKNMPNDIFDGIASNKYRRHPINGNVYTLYYWDNGVWNRIQQNMATDNKLKFHNIPNNALLQLTDSTGKFVNRCFTIQNGEIKWW